ncbi:hypothetical protein D3C85_1506480 [compost metagenome]
MKVATSTTSPTVISRLTTPRAASHMISVTPVAMITPWPALSMDSDTWFLIAERSHDARLPS